MNASQRALTPEIEALAKQVQQSQERLNDLIFKRMRELVKERFPTAHSIRLELIYDDTPHWYEVSQVLDAAGESLDVWNYDDDDGDEESSLAYQLNDLAILVEQRDDYLTILV